MKTWRSDHGQEIKKYSRDTHDILNTRRYNRRRVIASLWGINLDWRQAEVDAAKILGLEGFSDIHHFGYVLTAPFDYTATRHGVRYVFQITTSIHTYKKNQQRMATAMGMVLLAMFVSPMFKKYVIKKITSGGYAELNLKEAEEARRYL
jgi:hypothetical protein